MNKGPKWQNKPKVKAGQVWRRRRDGFCIVIVATHNGDTYRCVNLINRKIQHHIAKKTLWLFYELIEKDESK